MAKIEIASGVELYYEDEGQGTPIVFIHGVWMSSKFFKEQIPDFKEGYRAISVDLRGHGRSSKVQDGHTIETYAKDLHAFLKKLELKDVVLVGWSMGAFVVWEYLQQFGEQNVQGTVIVDELASDFKWPDFPIGAFDLATLTYFMREVQVNREEFLKGFLPLMFKEDLSDEDVTWMLEETTSLPVSVASAILFDQSVVDYRALLPSITVPTLLCFGTAEKLIPVAAGEHLRDNLPNAKLVLFDESCHCPFLEEPQRFNKEVKQFIESL